MNQLMKKEMVDGLNYDVDTHPRKNVKHVFLAKCRRSPFTEQSQHRATRPYEIVHSDVYGPMQVESKGGSKYIVTFTDDFSRYTTAHFLKSKGEVLLKFIEYVNSVERHTGNQIQETEHSRRGRC